MVSLKFRKALCVLYSWILFLSGVVLICFAIILAYKLLQYNEFVPFNYYGPCILLCFLGFIHLLVTWLGIRGPTREHDFHIIAFIVVSGLLFFIEIGTGIWTIIIWNNVENTVSLLMQNSLDEYVSHDYDKKIWKRLEREFQCCGYYGFTDYNKTESVPLSCCSTSNSSSSCIILEKGCRDPLVDHIEYLILQISAIGFSASLYQILGIVTFGFFIKYLKLERLNRSTLRRSRVNSLRRQMSHAGIDPAAHM